MSEPIKIELELKTDIYNELLKFVEYEKLHNYFDEPNREIPTIENYIRGSIVREINLIETLRNLNDEKFMDKKLKNNFKNLMDKYNVTLTEIEEFTGINISNLSRILNNKVQPSLESFIRLWHFFYYEPLENVIYRE